MQIRVFQDTLINGQWTGVGVGNFAPHIAEHLIQIGVAQPIETKVVEPTHVKKSGPPSPASPAGPASPRPTAGQRRAKPRRSSR